MSDATTGVAQANARVSTMPKLSPPSDGARSAFVERSRSVRLLLREEADDVDPVVGDTEPGEQQPHGERVGAGDDEPRAGAPLDLRPGPEQHLESLARLVPAREDDGVLALGGIRVVRDRARRSGRPPRARRASVGRRARPLGDRDPLVDPCLQEAPAGIPSRIQPRSPEA